METNLQFKAKEVALLTGAGFSANFGCPLAPDMWSWIFNHWDIQLNPRVRELMLKTFSFESVVHQVRNGNYQECEKKAVEASLRSAYEDLDGIIQSYNFNQENPYALNLYGLQNFLTKFSAEKSDGQVGYIFSLNQDLFLERQLINPAVGRQLPVLFGIKNNGNWFKGTSGTLTLTEERKVKLPLLSQIESTMSDQLGSSRLMYVKLHGSQDWVGSGNQHQMVIGVDKVGQISQEPLLKVYSQIFNNLLGEHIKHLLIIGYGFGDDHINQALMEGVRKKLKIFVINPGDPEFFHSQLVSKSYGQEIWNAICGYFPYYLKDVFPSNQNETMEKSRIESSVFRIN